MHELSSLLKYDPMAVPIINCMREHEVPIEMPRGMNIIELKKALTYGAHSLSVKETVFVRK